MEWHGIWQELRVGELESDIEQLSTQAHVRIVHVGGRGIEPVELVGGHEGLELFQGQVELPGVGDKVEEILRRFGRPVVE